MAASTRPPKNCNDNNDTNPNCNWKSNSLFFLNVVCIVADDYLIPMLFPEEALAYYAASTAISLADTFGVSSFVANAASAVTGFTSSFFRRKEAHVVATSDIETPLNSDADYKAVAVTSKKKLAAEATLQVLIPTLASTFGKGLVQQAKFGGRAAVVTTAGLQAIEFGRWAVRKYQGVDMITDDAPASSATSSPAASPSSKK